MKNVTQMSSNTALGHLSSKFLEEMNIKKLREKMYYGGTFAK